tara:strand:+ start:4225 stop:5346 length:1122 start_codon:yes stop_codon:yes gene_type:complete
MAMAVAAMSIHGQSFASEGALEDRVKALESELQSRNNSAMGAKVHLTGYANVDFVVPEEGDGSVSQVRYAPIFHYGFSDWLLFEAELEIEVGEEGEAELGMEYADFNILVNDNMILQVGKFLSPVGQFRQNLHPAWINKLPSAPLGFGHGGAAPVGETGVQARGGFEVAGMRSNYAVFGGNGASVEGHGGALDLETGGRTGDIAGEHSYGGRLGLLPLDTLEIGVSYMGGKAGYVNARDEDNPNDDTNENADLTVYGADFVYFQNSFTLRGEYVKSELDRVELEDGEAVNSTELEAWYLQASSKVASTPFEAVVRYSEYEKAFDTEISKNEQWALGVNYLFAPQTQVKVAYEFNKQTATINDDRLLVQLAHGF